MVPPNASEQPEAYSGHLDLRTEVEFASALRADTPPLSRWANVRSQGWPENLEKQGLFVRSQERSFDHLLSVCLTPEGGQVGLNVTKDIGIVTITKDTTMEWKTEK